MVLFFGKVRGVLGPRTYLDDVDYPGFMMWELFWGMGVVLGVIFWCRLCGGS